MSSLPVPEGPVMRIVLWLSAAIGRIEKMRCISAFLLMMSSNRWRSASARRSPWIGERSVITSTPPISRPVLVSRGAQSTEIRIFRPSLALISTSRPRIRPRERIARPSGHSSWQILARRMSAHFSPITSFKV